MSAPHPSIPPSSASASTLRREFELVERPGLKKCEASTRAELCTDHAAKAFALGLEALDESWSLRRVGAHLKVTERTVRDYRDGFRSPPLPKILALPKPARLAAMRYLVSIVPELEVLCG